LDCAGAATNRATLDARLAVFGRSPGGRARGGADRPAGWQVTGDAVAGAPASRQRPGTSWRGSAITLGPVERRLMGRAARSTGAQEAAPCLPLKRLLHVG